jgi:hypothetical protein
MKFKMLLLSCKSHVSQAQKSSRTQTIPNVGKDMGKGTPYTVGGNVS